MASELHHERELAHIERSADDGVHVVSVRGELDISNVGELRGAVAGISNDALGLVVDLTDATFIDSATVGLLFDLRRSLARRNQILRVVCRPAGAAAQTLALMSFDERSRGETSVEAAVASIRRELPSRG